MTPTMYHRAPLTKRISVLALTAVAALGFAVFSPNAQANHVNLPKLSKEYLALKAKLLGNQSVEGATAQELRDAIILASQDSENSKLKLGNIAGEALKHAGSNAQDGGEIIAEALAANSEAARDAILRAGKGRDLNVSLVPEFAAAFFNDNNGALALAKAVKKSKPGAGAVVGGRAGQLADDVDAETQLRALANEALAKSSGLTAAAQDVMKFIVAEHPGDTAVFTKDVASANAGNVKLATKIGTGAVAGDPRNGGSIVAALLNSADLPKLKSGITGFAKTVANVADIEEMVNIAIAIGDQMGITVGTSTAIKLAKANSVISSLAKAIVAKSTTDDPDPARNSITNKRDEIAEVVAYMVAKALNPATVSPTTGKAQINDKNAGAKILGMIKSAVNATKGKKVENATNSTFFLDTATDIVGSVAETLGSMRDSATPLALDFDRIIGFLTDKAKTIAGKTNAVTLGNAMTEAYVTGADNRFEDGLIAENAEQHDVPPTDFRLF